MQKCPLKIFFADLRYDYLGVLTSDAMPLGIGLMGAFMQKNLGNLVEVELFASPSELEHRLNDCTPDVLLLTNYIWNKRLGLTFANFIKKKSPSTLVIMGGPNISLEDQGKLSFVAEHPVIDIYVYGEGDFLATEIVEKYIALGLSKKKLLQCTFHSSIYKKDECDYIITPLLARSKILEDIPSPYLNGLMDKFFKGQYAPMIETNRGCPFKCTFCVQGVNWYTKINNFPLDRIKEELTYIAKRIHESGLGQTVLRIADPNFGMYERDLEIAEHIGHLQKKYQWPVLIDATTGKNNSERIIKALEKVGGSLVMYNAVQSLNEDVLENIQRKNIKLESYAQIQMYIQARGMKSNSDLIFGLPGENLNSHLQSIKSLLDSGINKISNFQAILLKGSEMEMKSQREKFKFKTRFRLVPKNFGIYFEQKVFDIEEIVVENENISFDDYLLARRYHFLISIFWNTGRFHFLFEKAKDLGMSRWDIIERLNDELKNNDNKLYNLISHFIRDTKNELFESETELLQYYSEDGTFTKLINNEIGDNLIYKYISISSFIHWDAVVDCFVDVWEKLLLENFSKVIEKEFLNNLKYYLSNKYISFKDINVNSRNRKRTFVYDIQNWLDTGHLDNLTSYKVNHEREYFFTIDSEIWEKIISVFAIWNNDERALSMLVKRIHPQWLERKIYVIETVPQE